MRIKACDETLALIEDYQKDCTEWFSGMGPASPGAPFSLKGVLHSNDRYRFAMDHPYRTGIFKRLLIHYGLWRDYPTQKSSFAVDLSHDLLKLAVGGAFATSAYIWASRMYSPQYVIPRWADRILLPVRFFRLYVPLVCAGGMYYTIYNYLTGVLDWPVTKHEDPQYAASFVASSLVTLSYALLVPIREAIRPSVAFDSRFARFYKATAAVWLYIFAYNFINAVGWDGSNSHPRTNENSYIRQLTNPPGYNIVRQMPHLPYYKESPAFPHNDGHQLFTQPWKEYYVRNPHYDPEYTAKAKAQAQQVLANYRI